MFFSSVPCFPRHLSTDSGKWTFDNIVTVWSNVNISGSMIELTTSSGQKEASGDGEATKRVPVRGVDHTTETRHVERRAVNVGAASSSDETLDECHGAVVASNVTNDVQLVSVQDNGPSTIRLKLVYDQPFLVDGDSDTFVGLGFSRIGIAEMGCLVGQDRPDQRPGGCLGAGSVGVYGGQGHDEG